MLRGLILLLFCASLLVSSCHNEPYALFPLGVVTFRDVGAGTTSTHVYKGGKIQSFTRTAGSDTLTALKFLYQGDRLNTIMKDSSSAGYDLIKITGFGAEVTTDSVFSIVGEVTTLKEVRKQVYDVNHLLERIELNILGGAAPVQSAYELDWIGSNVSEIRTIGINEGTNTVEHVLAISYDDRMGVFSSEIPYVYTLPPAELYWLSANNPVWFKLDDDDEAKYIYHYNLKSYPSRILTDKKEFLSFTYTELR